MLSQISVYTENRKGALAAMTRTLSDAGIDLYAFVTNESAEFGTVRMLVSDEPRACLVLAEAGYLLKRSSVLAVEVEDKVGGLAGLLETIQAANLNIDYLYAAYGRKDGKPIIVLHAEDPEELECSLTARGYRSLR